MWVATPAILLALAGCLGNDSTTAPVNNAANIPWVLRLNYKAINMSVGSSVQLTTTALALDQTPITGLPAVTWTTPDSTILAVDANGKLVAKQEIYRAMVVAQVRSIDDGWTIADTSQVTVYPAALPVASFEMIPDGPALVTADQGRGFDAALFDAAGNVLLDAAGDTIYPVTSYTASAPMSTWYQYPFDGWGQPHDIGEVTVRGRSWIFGQEYEDSLTFQLTYPEVAPVIIYAEDPNVHPSPSAPGQTDVTILKGGKIQFSNVNVGQKADILFDDTTAVIGGNIPEVPEGYAWQTPPAEVTFPNTGVFTYSSPLLGFTGTITVVDWPEWP